MMQSFGCETRSFVIGVQAMSDIHPEIASHVVGDGMFAVRLHDGPWDGKVVGVRVVAPPLVQVNGPRHGDHRVWITHLYERRGGRYEFVSTEVTPLEEWAEPVRLGRDGKETHE
jgi:hypothetical protein